VVADQVSDERGAAVIACLELVFGTQA
jgi:hypothetical protein